MADFKNKLRSGLAKMGEAWEAAGPETDAQREREQSEASAKARDKPLWRFAATYEGSTRIPGSTKPGRGCEVVADRRGIAVRSSLKSNEILRFAWADIADLEVSDASRTEIKTRIAEMPFGGLSTSIFTTTPVPKTQSKFVGQCFLRIETTKNYECLLRVHAEAKKLEARLMETSHLRPKPAEAPAMVEAKADPLEQLEKLGQLRDAGVLTDDEFQTKKAELLRRL